MEARSRKDVRATHRSVEFRALYIGQYPNPLIDKASNRVGDSCCIGIKRMGIPEKCMGPV